MESPSDKLDPDFESLSNSIEAVLVGRVMT